jgi:hypothetical protein
MNNNAIGMQFKMLISDLSKQKYNHILIKNHWKEVYVIMLNIACDYLKKIDVDRQVVGHDI